MRMILSVFAGIAMFILLMLGVIVIVSLIEFLNEQFSAGIAAIVYMAIFVIPIGAIWAYQVMKLEDESE